MLAIIYRRALYNIYYDNILAITKTEILNMMFKSIQLIKSHAINCSRFLKVKGDRVLAAWIQFGMQETCRIINKFPSVSSYIHDMTDPDQPDNTENNIEDNITRYRIRFLNNMKVTTPHMAIRMQYQRIYLEQTE